MAIDLTTETLIALTRVPRRLPRRRAEKRVHITCVYRWTKNGCRGVVLESIQIGGTRCTSLEALGRFFAALTEQAGLGRPATARTPAQRDRAVARAVAELESSGA